GLRRAHEHPPLSASPTSPPQGGRSRGRPSDTLLPRHARHFSRLAIVKERPPSGGKTGGRSDAHLSKQCDLAAARPASPEVRREFVPWRDRTAGARKHRPLRSGTGPARCPCRARCFRRFALPQPRRTPKPAPWRSVLRPLHRATLAPCRGPVPPRTTTVMIGVPAGGTGAW